MKKIMLIAIAMSFTFIVYGQNQKKDIKIYGGIPTSNESMSWEQDNTPTEFYTGVIQVDPKISSSEIIDAFMATFQTMQDANIMTKQMRSNNAFGSTLSVLNGDSDSFEEFTSAGDSDLRMQNHRQNTWTVQFIDGVRLSRFYYNVSVQTKDGRYKLTVTPSGTSGYANDHIQYEWSHLFKKGEVKSSYSKYYNQMKIKLAYTIDQWITKVDDYLATEENDDW